MSGSSLFISLLTDPSRVCPDRKAVREWRERCKEQVRKEGELDRLKGEDGEGDWIILGRKRRHNGGCLGAIMSSPVLRIAHVMNSSFASLLSSTIVVLIFYYN
jgi:hypothetical protein